MSDQLTPEEVAKFRKDQELKELIKKKHQEVNQIVSNFRVMDHTEKTEPKIKEMQRELALKQGELYKLQDELSAL